MVYDLGDEHSHIFVALEGLRRRAEMDMARLTAQILKPLRGSHGRILGLIPDQGIRPSGIAAGAWITKQAVGTRLKEMEDLGWVRMDPDPTDGRALLVKRTAAGTRIGRAALAAIAQLESEWAEAVGPDRYAVFRSVLDDLGQG